MIEEEDDFRRKENLPTGSGSVLSDHFSLELR